MHALSIKYQLFLSSNVADVCVMLSNVNIR